MKVLLLTPSPTEIHRGPASTVDRIRTGLSRRGHLCELYGGAGDGTLHESLEGTLERFRPEVVHAHDVYRSGVSLLGLQTPWVVSVTGDDIYRDLRDPKRSPLVCATLARANRVLVPSQAAGRLVEQAVPETTGKIDLVPRSSVPLPTDGTDLRRSLGIPRTRLLILLSGGLRPVKGQNRAIQMVQHLRSLDVDCELVIVGPEQDPAYAEELRQLSATEPRIRVLPPLSRERMGAAYVNADVVLNTSLDEAMSPVILEAGLLGRPVVASDVPGNRELVRHRETGLLYEDCESMTKCVLAIAKNRAAANALGLRMREDFKRRFGIERELDLVLSSYAAA